MDRDPRPRAAGRRPQRGRTRLSRDQPLRAAPRCPRSWWQSERRRTPRIPLPLCEAKDGIKILNLVPKESTWRYRDAPDAPPPNWNAPDGDDSAWASGPGKLGYGDPVRTSLSFGPDKNNKPLAAYFRTTFD